jgi:outer membrane lipoprotein SlyB
MRRFTIAAVAALSLSGCASTDKVMSKDATEVFYSKDSVNTVAFCLANKNNVPSLDKDDGSKVILIKNGYGGVSMAFTIFPHDGGGSKIELRKQFGTIGAIWKQCLGVAEK